MHPAQWNAGQRKGPEGPTPSGGARIRGPCRQAQLCRERAGTSRRGQVEARAVLSSTSVSFADFLS